LKLYGLVSVGPCIDLILRHSIEMVFVVGVGACATERDKFKMPTFKHMGLVSFDHWSENFVCFCVGEIIIT